MKFIVKATLLAITLAGVSSTGFSDGLSSSYNSAKMNDAEFALAKAEYLESMLALPIAKTDTRLKADLSYQVRYSDVNYDASGNYIEHGPEFSISQSLYNKFISENIAKTELENIKAAIKFELEEQELLSRVANAYLNMLIAGTLVFYANAEEAALLKQKDYLEDQYRYGLVANSDFKNALAQYDLAVSRKIEFSNQLYQAQEVLNFMTGESDRVSPDEFVAIPIDMPFEEGAEYWIQLSKELNPIIKLEQINKKLQESTVKLYKSNAFPTVSLVGSVGRNWTGQQDTENSEYARLMVELNLPILTGGKQRAEVEMARAAVVKAENNVNLTEKSTELEVRNSLQGLQSSVDKVKALSRALESTGNSLEAQEIGFREGLLSSIDMIMVLRDRYSLASDHDVAKLEFLKNYFSLKKSTGQLRVSDLVSIELNYLSKRL